ncbi:MAG: glycosyltransferase [Chitinophagales bacterium]|nr:glycosyltransferase [Bacteroidota bacterium]
MKILIVNDTQIPVTKYGGTERVIWYLGKCLHNLGHQVHYLVGEGSYCDFAKVHILDKSKPLAAQIPPEIDVVHAHFQPHSPIEKPYVVTMHGSTNDQTPLDKNTIFISKNQASRYGSAVFVHNGMDWNDYGTANFTQARSHFHFLGNAAWRVKNVRGAIKAVLRLPKEKLAVLGGHRLNFRMGFRFTPQRRIRFYGMIGGAQKFQLLNQSKGLIFPVLWNEPFGLAIIESLYFGSPVFATPYGSLPELVPKEVGFLANKLSELSDAMQHAADFNAKKCHEYAVENFNAEKMTRNYICKYEEVLNGKMLHVKAPVLQQIQTQKFLDWYE